MGRRIGHRENSLRIAVTESRWAVEEVQKASESRSTLRPYEFRERCDFARDFIGRARQDLEAAEHASLSGRDHRGFPEITSYGPLLRTERGRPPVTMGNAEHTDPWCVTMPRKKKGAA